MSAAAPGLRRNPDGTLANAAFEDAIRRNRLLDFEHMMGMEGGEVVKHAVPQRKTVRFRLPDGSRVYLKRHYPAGLGAALGNLLRLSPEPTAYDECLHIEAFHRAGIPTVVPIAAGRRAAGLLQSESFLVTQALEGCAKLDDCLAAGLLPQEKRDLTLRLARLVQKMHGAGFNHRDLYLCHILRDGGGELYIVDLHRVQRRPAVPQRWLVKDLAALNYSAPRPAVSRAYRLRFLKAYLGVERLSDKDKALVLKIVKKTRKMLEHNKRPKDNA